MVMGVFGSLLGLVLMRLYRQWIAPQVRKAQSEQADEAEAVSQPLDDISIAGQQHKQDESSTAALGRILYQWAADDEPAKETKSTLSYLVHWAYGMSQGGVYGYLRAGADGPDLRGGLLFGAALWFFGDEMMVPLLGLQKGPTAANGPQHFNRLGMHLAYGIGTAAATQALNRLFEEFGNPAGPNSR